MSQKTDLEVPQTPIPPWADLDQNPFNFEVKWKSEIFSL